MYLNITAQSIDPETGEFNILPAEERLCLFCKLDEIENTPFDVLSLFIQYDDSRAVLFFFFFF